VPTRRRCITLVLDGENMSRETGLASGAARISGRLVTVLAALATLLVAPMARASETEIKLPPIEGPGRTLLLVGLVVCALGFGFGLVVYSRLRNLPVHNAMREISELIYETCKTYLLQQGKFLAMLWLFIAAIIVVYFRFLMKMDVGPVVIIVLFSIVGILGSYGVAWFGIRINTFANSRTAFAALQGKPLPCYAIPLQAGISIGTVLISTELIIMLAILLFIPAEYAGACFMGFAIGESLGAAALRIAGGIFTKIADIGSDLIRASLPTAPATTPATRSAPRPTASRPTASRAWRSSSSSPWPCRASTCSRSSWCGSS
jgi:K(+)-stimulated pyrophosphate-energized sodium pump